MYGPDGVDYPNTVFEENEATFDKVKTYAVPGAEQTMDRLGEHLARMS